MKIFYRKILALKLKECFLRKYFSTGRQIKNYQISLSIKCCKFRIVVIKIRRKEHYLLSSFEQLPFDQFKKLLFVSNKQTIQFLFAHLFDIDFLKQYVVPLWCDQCYQLSYIQSKILSNLLKSKDACESLIAQFAHSTNRIPTKNTKVSGQKTFFQQFNLTKPKPKRIPTPEKIDNQFRAREYISNSLTLSEIQFLKKQRRQNFKQNKLKYYEQNKFAILSTDLRPTNISRVRRQMQQNRNKEYYTIQPLQLPKFKENQVKTNIATLLKQQKRIHDQIRDQQQKIKELTFNLRDQTEYKKWQQQLKMKEQYESMQNNQRRKIQIQLCKQRFAQSCQKKIQEKRQLVNQMKAFQANLMQERQAFQQKIMNQNKKIIGDVFELRQNIRNQKKNMEIKNRSLVLEKKDNLKRILNKKKQEDLVEMAKKKQLIAEIRQLESFLKSRELKKNLEIPSMGYMGQMSIYELKNKLKAVKQQRKQYQSKLREENALKRQNYKQEIQNKKNMILENRRQTNKIKQKQKQKKLELKQNERKRILSAQEVSMLQFKQKSLQKQKQKELKEIQQRKKQKEFQMQSRFKRSQFDYEGRAFRSIQQGLQRSSINRNLSKLLQDYESYFDINAKMDYIGRSAQSQAKSKVAFNQLYRQKLDKQILNGQQFESEHYQDKKLKYDLIRSFKNKKDQQSKKAYPYRHKISQLHIKSAKEANYTYSLSSIKKQQKLNSP